MIGIIHFCSERKLSDSFLEPRIYRTRHCLHEYAAQALAPSRLIPRRGTVRADVCYLRWNPRDLIEPAAKDQIASACGITPAFGCLNEFTEIDADEAEIQEAQRLHNDETDEEWSFEQAQCRIVSNRVKAFAAKWGTLGTKGKDLLRDWQSLAQDLKRARRIVWAFHNSHDAVQSANDENEKLIRFVKSRQENHNRFSSAGVAQLLARTAKENLALLALDNGLTKPTEDDLQWLTEKRREWKGFTEALGPKGLIVAAHTLQAALILQLESEIVRSDKTHPFRLTACRRCGRLFLYISQKRGKPTGNKRSAKCLYGEFCDDYRCQAMKQSLTSLRRAEEAYARNLSLNDHPDVSRPLTNNKLNIQSKVRQAMEQSPQTNKIDPFDIKALAERMEAKRKDREERAQEYSRRLSDQASAKRGPIAMKTCLHCGDSYKGNREHSPYGDYCKKDDCRRAYKKAYKQQRQEDASKSCTASSTGASACASTT